MELNRELSQQSWLEVKLCELDDSFGCCLQTPRRGSKQSAQGIALGIVKPRNAALKGQKHSHYNSYALSGRWTQNSINPGRCPGLIA